MGGGGVEFSKTKTRHTDVILTSYWVPVSPQVLTHAHNHITPAERKNLECKGYCHYYLQSWVFRVTLVYPAKTVWRKVLHSPTRWQDLCLKARARTARQNWILRVKTNSKRLRLRRKRVVTSGLSLEVGIRYGIRVLAPMYFWVKWNCYLSNQLFQLSLPTHPYPLGHLFTF